jgi:hypothetical protein
MFAGFAGSLALSVMTRCRPSGAQSCHSGMAWTVIQPNLYMDKLPLAAVGGPALAGQPVTLVGEGRRRHLD